MANTEIFYTGSKHSFEQTYAGFSGDKGYHARVSDIAYPTDPLTANQLKKVSDKISTGTKTIEVSGLGLAASTAMRHLAAIPRQHWKEIDRLRQLTGVDLTFHGPLVEATGYVRGANWSENQRVEVERQMMGAVELAQQMNSASIEKDKKGVVMTFHASNGLPEVERKIVVGRNKDGTPKEKMVQMAVYNEYTGQIGEIPFPNVDYFEGKKEKEVSVEVLKKINETQWTNQMESVFLNNQRIGREVSDNYEQASRVDENLSKSNPEMKGGVFGAYKAYVENPDEYAKIMDVVKKTRPESVPYVNQAVNNLNNAHFFVKESYENIKSLYNIAYNDLKKRLDNEPDDKKSREAIEKLDNYSKDLRKTMDEFKQNYDFTKIQDKLTQGTRLLQDKSIAPQYYKPLKEFAVEKGGETFANVALHAYQNAKDKGIAPGIISIENPPAGMGLTRAEEIVELVNSARKKFVKNAVDRKIMSENEATKVSKEIIGATWDVGHINSIRKWGYNKDDVVEQAKRVKDIVKHVHLADNLGFEDSELPMGMGNVPIDEIMNSEWSEGFRKAKKVVETGDWFSRQGGMGMTHTPVRESLSGMSAPVYSVAPSMGNAGAAYWNDAVNVHPGYFGGLGPINPDVHQSIYGGGFGQLPAYLGAELPGKATNSSFSGAPLE